MQSENHKLTEAVWGGIFKTTQFPTALLVCKFNKLKKANN